ncbi:unnamed protein product [Pedinophyceae sp. YPF-701]|nr:unnamed protein product [Pedinophyceae sp. YPF-701]
MLSTAGAAAVLTGVLPPGLPSHARSAVQTRELSSGTRISRSVEVGLREPAGGPAPCGLAEDNATREALGTKNLLPPAVTDRDTEVRRAMAALNARESLIGKYSTLMTLFETDPATFTDVVRTNTAQVLPIVYTPGVGEACKQWGTLVPRPPGLYVSAEDAGRVSEAVARWPADNVRVVVITDGERILGLGDLGAHGMGISVGKSMLYTVAAGIPPGWVLPVCLDVGCDSDAVRDDEFYVGLRRKRARGAEYNRLVDELVAALRQRYGTDVVLHFEDFGRANALPLLERYQDGPTLNDDIQSTAAITLGALLGSLRLENVPALEKQRVLLYGAGQANLGFARLFVRKLVTAGVPESEARKRVWLVDSKGLVYDGRNGVNEEKAEFAHPLSDLPNGRDVPDGLAAAVDAVRPTALVGASTIRGAFSAEVLKTLHRGVMAAHGSSARPIVMALSNPDTKAECTAEEVVAAIGDAVVFASGTAFPPAKLPGGGQLRAAQANNCLIFPGVALGTLAARSQRITEPMFLAAAEAVAQMTSAEELAVGGVLPDVQRLDEVADAVAAAVASTGANSPVGRMQERLEELVGSGAGGSQ